MVSKVFEKLVNRIVNHLDKCGLFFDFQYDFRSSQLTADLLTVASDRIARAFDRSGATGAVARDISKAFGFDIGQGLAGVEIGENFLTGHKFTNLLKPVPLCVTCCACSMYSHFVFELKK